jgi:hypothetical protein
VTGADGCYEWTNLGPVPTGYYDVSEDVPYGWTPTSATSYNFESPPVSGSSYAFTFTNFKNVDVTACKLKDADGSAATTWDRTPIPGWTVNLTKNGVVQDTKQTGANGCYTWMNLGPLPAGSYYDVSEAVPLGWVALTPTWYTFESPPKSGASYSFTFVNTPTQGCTPGFWQGGNDFGTAGGKWLWNENNDPQWSASGGAGTNPYKWDDGFCGFFGCSESGAMWYYVNPDMWSVNNDFHKAARSLVAAYLNASWNMAYAYTTTELETMWDNAVTSGDFLTLHNLLDAANNAPAGCPVSASGY